MDTISEPFTGCVICPGKSSKCVNDVNYNANCVTPLKVSQSNFVKIILFETVTNERN